GRLRMMLLGLVPVLALMGIFLLRARINSYTRLYSNFAEALVVRPEDPNLVMGRISGTLIVPRMIGVHPVLGIGLGNYSLMRNDPDYLQGLPSVEKWDLPGLGLVGSTAELGIPLTLFLLL